jgi:L-asparaginase / beta-aspartyl-peptidase
MQVTMRSHSADNIAGLGIFRKNRKMAITVITNEEGEAGFGPAIEAIQKGESPLDVVEKAIRIVELDPLVRTVGYGGAPNIMGEMEFDASILDGDTLQTGAVGALKGTPNAISVARKILERLPHVMLVGEGASRFAAECGLNNGQVLSGQTKEEYKLWVEKNLPPNFTSERDHLTLGDLVWKTTKYKPHGTVVYLVEDSKGRIAGGASTSGWSYKYPGRLGDSPIIGAGLYVDSRYGAAACTHTGEMSIRAGTARAVVLYMKKGASVEEACEEAFEDLAALKGGVLGKLAIYALKADGSYYSAITEHDERTACLSWREGKPTSVEPVRPRAA